ncbi:unnamed protein product [Knipowitschia caucasica]|uniref:Clarin 2 n=1 Tax=Knipowitschia caucasica TaxID=637954 RepID=A0AAV2KK27_KNICA
MVPLQKKLLLSLAAVLSLVCALLAVVAIAMPFWIKAMVLCRTGAELVNATASELQDFIGDVQYGLLKGTRGRQCGLGTRPAAFYFFSPLLVHIPAGLHVTVLVFSSVVVLFSSLSCGFFFYNAFGRPSHVVSGPSGLNLWTIIIGSAAFLVLVLFSAEVTIGGVTERIANFGETSFVFQTHSERFERCYWLFLLVLLLQSVNLLLTRLSGIHFVCHHGNKPPETQTGEEIMY